MPRTAPPSATVPSRGFSHTTTLATSVSTSLRPPQTACADEDTSSPSFREQALTETTETARVPSAHGSQWNAPRIPRAKRPHSLAARCSLVRMLAPPRFPTRRFDGGFVKGGLSLWWASVGVSQIGNCQLGHRCIPAATLSFRKVATCGTSDCSRDSPPKGRGKT